MPGMVKCGICGKLFNKRHVKSHMRLAHTKKPVSDSSAGDEQETVKEILQLYEQLSDQERQELQVRLKSMI